MVVEASINWYANTSGNEQKIKLSTTTGYFSNTIPTVSGATVFITNSSSQVFTFTEDGTAGTYKCYNFIPVVGENYTLTVIYLGETYTSSEKLLNTPAVTRIEQVNDGGILGNEKEVKFFFNDLQNETNQYFLRIDDPYKVITLITCEPRHSTAKRWVWWGVLNAIYPRETPPPALAKPNN